MEIDFKVSPKFDHHEFVKYFEDTQTGLKGFFAIHDTTLGRVATGGSRFSEYPSTELAIGNVLELSASMTKKCAMAEIPRGGGKAVIIMNNVQKTEKFLLSYAKQVNLLKGKFLTGEDVGVTKEDLKILSANSKYISGLDPGKWAALGVFYGIQVVAERLGQEPDLALRGVRVAIKGIGNVGQQLGELLYSSGADLVISDIDRDKALRFKRMYPGTEIADNSLVHTEEVDIYAPCALGGEFREDNVSKLNCRAICGSANNQLASMESGRLIFERGILNVTDYVANAGGLISVFAGQRRGGLNERWLSKKILGTVKKNVNKILDISKTEGKPTNLVSDDLVRNIIAEAKAQKRASI